MTSPESASALPPEAVLLRRARESSRPRKVSMREAARLAGVSETTWRHAEAGSEPRGQHRIPYRVTDSTLARMASAVGVTPDQLRGARRPEVAALVEVMAQQASSPAPVVPADAPLCSLEWEILSLGDQITDHDKAVIINHHRDIDPGHQTCRPLAEAEQIRAALLSVAAV